MWQSHELPGDSWLVICESSIDALSHAALYPNAEARYASIGGKPSPAQSELVRSTLASLPQRYSVVAAMDADVAGAKLVEMVHEAFKMTGRLDLYWQSQVPVGFKDWNDQLRAELEA
jgi:hypothetical protein